MVAKTKTKAKGRKSGVKKSMMFKSVPDKASCSVTRTMSPIDANATYDLNNICLQDFTRAANIAPNYQLYRITGIDFCIKPVLDTYAIGAGGVLYSKANFYYIIDKTASLPDNITLEGLKQSGAIVRALDEQPLHVKWRPSVLNENQAGGAQPGFAAPSGYSISPWLSTNQQANAAAPFAPSQVNHLGLVLYVEQAGNGGANVSTQFPIEVTVHFEFKKPMVNLIGSSATRKTAYAVIDASPDGVEGGTDGLTVPLAATRIVE